MEKDVDGREGSAVLSFFVCDLKFSWLYGILIQMEKGGICP